MAQYVSHIKKEACVDSSELLALEVVQDKAALAVVIKYYIGFKNSVKE